MFQYHPDPLATGSVEESPAVCDACGQANGFIFAGAVYAVADDLHICPWCIADGTAAAKFGASFNDTAPWAPESVPIGIVETIEERTPGFESWQGARWLFHCDDGAAFVGRVSGCELADYPEALADVRRECAENGWDEEQTEQYVGAMEHNGQVTGYLFRCLLCGRHLAYSDFS
jgi:uncharacterized protein